MNSRDAENGRRTMAGALNADARCRRDTNVVFRRIVDENILVPIRGKLADMQRVFALNDVAAHVWQALDGTRTLRAIADGVAAEFEVTATQAEADVRAFVEALQREGLVADAAAAQEPKPKPD